MPQPQESTSCPLENGIVVIDKPEGITSARTIQVLKKIPWIKKIGHTGTLDPFATGVMICGINQGTRLSRFFLHGDKTYVAELVLGIETDTQDATGKILSSAPEKVALLSEPEITAAIQTFEGEQHQAPPIYSALKHEGVPLYTLARMGKPVQKPARPIFVREIRILRIDLPSVFLEIKCSAGTYIRTLASDIGKKLSCGGHLKTLRRTESCGFSLADAIPFPVLLEPGKEKALKERLISMADALNTMDERIVDSHMAQAIKEGKSLRNILGPANGTAPFLKLIASDRSLVAVVEREGCGAEYKYCCVFNH